MTGHPHSARDGRNSRARRSRRNGRGTRGARNGHGSRRMTPSTLLGFQIAPFTPPHIPVKDAVWAVVLRLGLPVALACALTYGAPVGPLVATTHAIGFAAAVGVVWLAHWYYARWRGGSGQDHPHAVTVLRTILCCVAMMLAAELVARCWFVAQYWFVAWTFLSGTPELAAAWLAVRGMIIGGFLSTGLPATMPLIPAARLLDRLYRNLSARWEPSEATWWVDSVAGVVRIALYVFAILSLSASALMLYIRLTGGWTLWFEGSWTDGIAALVSQLSVSGMIGTLALWAVCAVVLDRLDLAVETGRRRDEGRGVVWYWGECALHATRLLAYAWFVVASLCRLVYLMYPDAAVGAMLPVAVRSAVFSPAVVGAAACAYATAYGWRAYRRWRDAPMLAWVESKGRGDRPDPRPMGIRCAAWLARLAAIGAVAALLVVGLWQALADGSLRSAMGLVWMAVGGAVARPNYWGMVVIVVAAAVAVVLGLAVVLAVMSGGGGGAAGSGAAVGGAVAGGGASGDACGGIGGAASFGSGGRSTTVRDRYGRRLATIEESDSPLFCTRVTDRYGRTIGHVDEGLFGDPRVTIDDDEYRVRDAVLGSDRIVSKNGEDIGRIERDGDGGARYRGR